MPKKRAKIPEQDTIDLILKRLAGMTLEEIADEYGVSKQVVQYHETKELTQELKMVVLRRAAEVAGEALRQRALEKNGIALAQAQREDDDDTALSNLFLAGASGGDRCNGRNGRAPLGGNGETYWSRVVQTLRFPCDACSPLPLVISAFVGLHRSASAPRASRVQNGNQLGSVDGLDVMMKLEWSESDYNLKYLIAR